MSVEEREGTVLGYLMCQIVELCIDVYSVCAYNEQERIKLTEKRDQGTAHPRNRN